MRIVSAFSSCHGRLYEYSSDYWSLTSTRVYEYIVCTYRIVHVCVVCTVDPRLSGPRLSGPSIIWTRQLCKKKNKKKKPAMCSYTCVLCLTWHQPKGHHSVRIIHLFSGNYILLQLKRECIPSNKVE